MGWVALTADWEALGGTLAAARPAYLALSLALAPLLPWINAWKWRLLLRARGMDIGIAACFRLYLLGYFYSNFLPTSVGGDVVRMVVLARQTNRTEEAAASVFVERFTGLSVLALLAVVVAPFGARELYLPPARVGLVLLSVGYLLLLWGVLDRRAEALIRRWESVPGVGLFARAHGSVRRYRSRRRALGQSLLLSFGFYVGAMFNTFLSARAFGAELSLAHAALATPLILAITLLPISIGGLGLLEWACVFTLQAYGVAPAASLATALLMRFKNIGLGIGGALWFGLPTLPPESQSGRATSRHEVTASP